MAAKPRGNEAAVVAAGELDTGIAGEVDRRSGDSKRKPQIKTLNSIPELKSCMQDLGHSRSGTEKIARPCGDAAHRSGGAVEGAAAAECEVSEELCDFIAEAEARTEGV